MKIHIYISEKPRVNDIYSAACRYSAFIPLRVRTVRTHYNTYDHRHTPKVGWASNIVSVKCFFIVLQRGGVKRVMGGIWLGICILRRIVLYIVYVFFVCVFSHVCEIGKYTRGRTYTRSGARSHGGVPPRGPTQEHFCYICNRQSHPQLEWKIK